MKMVWIAMSLVLIGCANVGYRADSRHHAAAAQPCKDDCEGKRKLCPVNDTACLNEYPKCLKACERWSGVRDPNGTGHWSVDLP